MKKNYLLFLGFSLLMSVQLYAQNSPNATLACVTGLGGASDPAFVNFAITGTTLSHQTLSPLATYYHEYPQEGSTTATLEQGREYTFVTSTTSEAVIGIWIDYNHNDDFEENEYTLLVNSMSSQNTTNLTIDPETMLGNTKIRLRTRAYGSTIAAANACTSFGSGETRDYTVLVVAPLPEVCVTGLGGGSDPSFLNLAITGTTFSHETLSAPTVYYHEYPQQGNTTANLVIGQVYSAFTFTSSEAVIGMWIDYNHNNDFEESEFIQLVNSMSSQNNSTFTISEDALEGNTKIRLRSRAYGSIIAGTNACTSFGSGETRDYTVQITPALSIDNFQKVTDRLQVYPNPATNIITVGQSIEVKEVILYDISGKIIATNTTNILDISNYSAGLYIVKVLYHDGQSSVGKVVKK